MKRRYRVAIVAASSQGLGFAVARALAREGVKLAICSRSLQAIEAAAARMEGVEVFAAQCDVTVESEAKALVEAVNRRFGPIDICVTNAGGPPFKRFEETSVEDWHRAIGLCLMSTVYFAREVLPLMPRKQPQRCWWSRQRLSITSSAGS